MQTRLLTGALIAALTTTLLFAGPARTLGAGGPPKRSRKPAASSSRDSITLSGDNQKVSVLLQKIMASVHANYTIDAGLADSYSTIRLKNVSLTAALNALSRSCTRPFSYRLASGIYHFALTGATNLSSQRITVDTQNTSLPAVISAIMRQAHGDYVLDRDLTGTSTVLVTMSLNSVPLPAAIDSLIQASSVPITCRIETGTNGAQIYHFMSRARADRAAGIASGKIRYTDESLDKDASLTGIRVSQDFENVYLTHALKTLLDKIPLRFEIDASVEDTTVTQHLENIPLPMAIKLLVRATGQPVTYHFENNVLRFTRDTAQK